MENDFDFENLPDEEQARLVAEFDARLEASNERKAHELEQLQSTNQQLRAHLARRREFALWLEQLVTQVEREDALLREEKKKILAAA